MFREEKRRAYHVLLIQFLLLLSRHSEHCAPIINPSDILFVLIDLAMMMVIVVDSFPLATERNVPHDLFGSRRYLTQSHDAHDFAQRPGAGQIRLGEHHHHLGRLQPGSMEQLDQVNRGGPDGLRAARVHHVEDALRLPRFDVGVPERGHRAPDLAHDGNVRFGGSVLIQTPPSG